MEVRTCPCPTMKLLLLGLSLVLCVGVAEALRCHVCKYKIPLVGCFRGANVTTCERREKCALIKSTLGKVTLYYQQGCTSTLNCGRERASDAESRLTSRYSCCETDLCNEEWGEEPTD
ncbi:ly-6/neurotoxin-like protein 1 [Corvus cornix cornix]|nr:PREDICTED: ly-6/neurotoxin-like protein 1 [Corvus brachyrhynchos]XP_039428437.1 ly-6/neurotoxin-like protein 1 [Corvus cornix cornix]XP_048149022.1 ly-6/neurotoxin-like protein 1 [Corvus hawaiiensis]